MWSVRKLVNSITRYYADHRESGSVIALGEKVVLGICAMDKKVRSFIIVCVCVYVSVCVCVFVCIYMCVARVRLCVYISMYAPVCMLW